MLLVPLVASVASVLLMTLVASMASVRLVALMTLVAVVAVALAFAIVAMASTTIAGVGVSVVAVAMTIVAVVMAMALIMAVAIVAMIAAVALVAVSIVAVVVVEIPMPTICIVPMSMTRPNLLDGLGRDSFHHVLLCDLRERLGYLVLAKARLQDRLRTLLIHHPDTLPLHVILRPLLHLRLGRHRLASRTAAVPLSNSN
mmetsp:Transcript_102199/g.256228  ORF Transcript_102199/g.256228 Transcript_102199/m.256228 type:complete len:200 (+) Transcript_102199:328-927(+)